jgi:hypothetical protein
VRTADAFQYGLPLCTREDMNTLCEYDIQSVNWGQVNSILNSMESTGLQLEFRRGLSLVGLAGQHRRHPGNGWPGNLRRTCHRQCALSGDLCDNHPRHVSHHGEQQEGNDDHQ